MKSLRMRAAVAVMLMTGFYFLALAIAAALLAIPIAEFVFAERIHGRVLVFCFAGAGIILWSIFPRVDRFAAPGPLLTADRHPKLLAFIASVARRCGQPMPDEVYAVSDINAFVMQRGGWMGLGSRRVMGIGLPLMEVLGVRELESVLAHEFGHFHGGDTKLGPWIYKTRGAIGRTLENLGDHASVLMKPFEWYGTLFMKITQSISRQQELAADQLSARVAGVDVAARALEKVHREGIAFQSFWNDEYSPAFEKGFVLPLLEGYRAFRSEESIAARLEAVHEQALAETVEHPYDSHPPIRDRVAALRALQPSAPPASEPETRAISLLGDSLDLDREAVRALRADSTLPMTDIEWDAVTEQVYVPAWKGTVLEIRDSLAGLTTDSLIEIARDPGEFARSITPSIPDQYCSAWASHLVGSAVAIRLRKQGWACEAPPGRPVILRKGDLVIEPFRLVETLATPEGEATFNAICEQASLKGLSLSPAP